MVGSTLGVYSFGLTFVSARTNKRHHHHVTLPHTILLVGCVNRASAAKKQQRCASRKPMQSGAQQRIHVTIHRNPKKCADILASLGFADAPPLEAAGKLHIETRVPVDRIVCVAAQVRTALFDAGMRVHDLLGGPGVSGEDGQVWRGEHAKSAKYKRPTTASSQSRVSTGTRQQTLVVHQSAHQSYIAHQSRSRRELRQMELDFHFLEEHDGQHDETDQPMSPTRAVQSQVASSFSPVVDLSHALQARVSWATLETTSGARIRTIMHYHTSSRLATTLLLVNS
jgi:hypothetical protein